MPTLPLVSPTRFGRLLAITLLLSSGFAAEKTPLSPDAETKNLDASLQRILRTASIRPITAGFALVDRHLYFSSGANVCRYRIP